MSPYGILIIKLISLFFLFSSLIGCTEKTYKRTYDVNSCLQETLRMVASHDPNRQMIYKVKEYKSNSYVLYLRFNKQWWYYRTIHENELLDRDLDSIKCPDFSPSIFKGNS